MKRYSRITAVIILGAVLISTILVLRSYLMHWVAKQNQATLMSINVRIAEQEKVLVKITDLIQQNGADETLSKIITDCSSDERQQFDTLLGGLSAHVSGNQLTTLNTLFYKCGSFYAVRRAVMAARLQREVAIYADYVALQDELLSKATTSNTRVNQWLQLAAVELNLAEDFNHLVKLQGDIIAALMSGKTKNSPEITGTLTEVATTRDDMTILSKQIERFRQDLSAL